MEKSEFGKSYVEVDDYDSFAIVQEDNLDNDIGYSSQMIISNIKFQQLPGSIVVPEQVNEEPEVSKANGVSNKEKAVQFELEGVEEEKYSVASVELTINTIRQLKEKSETLEKLITDTNASLKRIAEQKRHFEDAISRLKDELEKKSVEVNDLREANALLKQKVSDALRSNNFLSLKSLLNDVKNVESEVNKENELVNEYEEMCRSVERLQKMELLNEPNVLLEVMQKQNNTSEENTFEDLREKLTDFNSLSQKFDSLLNEAVKQRKEKEFTIKIVKKMEEDQKSVSTEENVVEETSNGSDAAEPKSIDIPKPVNNTAISEPEILVETVKSSSSSFGSYQGAKDVDMHLCLKCMQYFEGADGIESHNNVCKSIF